MHYIILLSLISLAVADHYWQPEDLPCCCVGCGDPQMKSYDGAHLLITDPQKNLISAWGDPNGDPTDNKYLDACKFGVRIVTKDNIAKTPTDVYYDWVGFGFGQKPVTTKNWRNFLLGQDTSCRGLVGVRGQGFKNGVETDFPNPLCMTQPVTIDGVEQDCEWCVEEKNPHFFTVRSSCCPYAFNWYPNCEDTCWEMFVGGSSFRDGSMTGMCGDCNNEIKDDFRGCPRGPQFDPIGFLTQISDTCSSGKNQGNGFPGGQRLG